MVSADDESLVLWLIVFQYSLCRVVLMVAVLSVRPYRQDLSVLALSSRFDGQHPPNLHFIP